MVRGKMCDLMAQHSCQTVLVFADGKDARVDKDLATKDQLNQPYPRDEPAKQAQGRQGEQQYPDNTNALIIVGIIMNYMNFPICSLDVSLGNQPFQHVVGHNR